MSSASPIWRRNRRLAADNARLEARIEELGDRNWELKELAERSHTFLEALGDVIVRRGADGRISYANDAFCRLAGFSGQTLIGRDIALPLLEQGPVAALPDGTRMHDQKIAAPDGPRWIAWRDVAIRDAASGVSETQSVGREQPVAPPEQRGACEREQQRAGDHRGSGQESSHRRIFACTPCDSLPDEKDLARILGVKADARLTPAHQFE